MSSFPLFVANNDSRENEISDCNIVIPDNFSTYYLNFFYNSFSLLHLNIRSCRQNFVAFHIFLTSLICKFPIIALNKTWLTNDVDLLFGLDGYNEFNQYRNSHGGGIKLYIRDSFNVNVLNELCITSTFYESLVCEIVISGIKFVICCVYRPPGSNINDFNNQFETNFLRKISKNKRIIICGDLNINLYNPLKLSSINNFILLMLQYNFFSHINYPTRYNLNEITSFSLLNQIWSNFIPLNPTSGVIKEVITNHFPIFLFVFFGK